MCSCRFIGRVFELINGEPGVGTVGDYSSIEWTDATWNPATGCDRVAAGCDNCYALSLAKRLKAMGVADTKRDGDPRTGPGFAVTIHPDALDAHVWRRPRLVFVNSMSDLFHAKVPFAFVREVFDVIRRLRGIRIGLTKRAQPMARIAESSTGQTTFGWASRWRIPRPVLRESTTFVNWSQPRFASCRASRYAGHRCPVRVLRGRPG